MRLSRGNVQGFAKYDSPRRKAQSPAGSPRCYPHWSFPFHLLGSFVNFDSLELSSRLKKLACRTTYCDVCSWCINLVGRYMKLKLGGLAGGTAGWFEKFGGMPPATANRTSASHCNTSSFPRIQTPAGRLRFCDLSHVAWIYEGGKKHTVHVGGYSLSIMFRKYRRMTL